MSGKLVDRVKGYFLEFLEGYRKGRERFGMTWTVFTVSMIMFSVILFLFAIIAAVLYL